MNERDFDIEELSKRIKKFLGTQVKRDMDDIEVSETDFKELGDIFDEIITQKWEADYKGYVPIQNILLDRTRYYPLNYFQIRADYESFPISKKEYLRNLDLMEGNLSMAKEELSREIGRIVHYNRLGKFEENGDES